jgi:sterol desaturase/sphingolipid hydroxylase (fatty acid hydroxylase superfamily)
VNDAVMRVVGVFPVLLLGFAPIAVAGIVPVLTVMAILVHANLDWDWGPLRSVISSPRFHRWHHTDEEQARDKNFAGQQPVWDILSGAYYMPKKGAASEDRDAKGCSASSCFHFENGAGKRLDRRG